MGYFSELDIEMQNEEIEARGIEAEQLEQEIDFDWQAEQAVDFDENNYTDGAWWAEQDAELRAAEVAHVEAQAEIQEMIHNGYWE